MTAVTRRIRDLRSGTTKTTRFVATERTMHKNGQREILVPAYRPPTSAISLGDRILYKNAKSQYKRGN